MLDTDFNPFNDHLLASGSEDGKVIASLTPCTFTFARDFECHADFPVDDPT